MPGVSQFQHPIETAGGFINRLRGFRFHTRILVVPYFGFLCAISVFSVPLWLMFMHELTTTEAQRTQRLHREEV